MHRMNEQSFLQFSDRLEYVANQLGAEPWVTVYEHAKLDHEEVGYFCALAPPGIVERCLGNTSWDLMLGGGTPGFTSYGDGRHEYLRFGDDNGIESFIIDRDFHGLKPSYLEVSEEFRHFHNLYEDRTKGVFTALDESGDDVEVVRVTSKKVQVRAKFLKEYLGARGMVMLLFFNFDRWSSKTLDELGLEKQDEDTQEETYRYIRWVDMLSGMTNPERRTFARFMGKKVVKGAENYLPAWIRDREGRQYEQFIIGVDGEGDNLYYTCDEDELANYFGKNPGSPQYLTPVFFNKSVMAKYYNDPAKYRVEDSHLYCGGYWGLRLDNNHRDYVVVYLGDLGKLSHMEQLYWKSFNVVPDGSVSDVAFRRDVLGEWAYADEPALVFKATYERFGNHWRLQFGWDLFKPLRPADAHHLTALHVPSDGNQKEFDEQIMSLAKLMVDRLNEAEVAKLATPEPQDKGGITKFGRYLTAVDFPDTQAFVGYLRNLQSLRSGAAHVKNPKSNSDYQKAVRYFDLDKNGFSRGFEDLLNQASTFIEKLAEHSLTTDDE